MKLKNPVIESGITMSGTTTRRRKTMVKCCKDCEFVHPSPLAGGSSQCRRIDPKTGEPISFGSTCDLQRSVPWPLDLVYGFCGKRGRFFKLKEEKRDGISE